MNRDKQIEEMAFNLIMATSPLGVKDLTKQFDYKTVATDLYELYGWRKTSDVAREIFEEINELKKQYASGDIDGNTLYVQLYMLEKKYTEDGK